MSSIRWEWLVGHGRYVSCFVGRCFWVCGRSGGCRGRDVRHAFDDDGIDVYAYEVQGRD